MFRKMSKPVIKVIAVQTEVREFEDERTEFTTDYRGYGERKAETKTSKHKHPVTIVLLSKDGELMTREFNGDWKLDDIKSWESLDGRD